MVKQGNFDNTNLNVDISQSQFVLNWLSAGGNLEDASYGNNTVYTKSGDSSYNIADNKISFNNKPNQSNISVYDSQFIINLNATAGGSSAGGDFAGKSYPKPINYEYPVSRDFVCLVEQEEFSVDGETYHKNKLYLKRKSKNVKDISFSKYILSNSIQYLDLDEGNLIKEIIYSFLGHIETSSNVSHLYINYASFSGDIVTFLPPLSSSLAIFDSVFSNCIIDLSNTSFKIQSTIFAGNLPGSPLGNALVFLLDKPVPFNFLGNKNISFTLFTHYNKKLFPPTEGTKDSTYLNINENLPENENIYKYTEFKGINISNRGVESIDISNGIPNSRLIKLNTLSTTTYNLLTESGYNKTNWVMVGQEVNDSQSHLIGQFVFDASAQGNMIYQYYYDISTSNTQYQENSPHTVYFNISGGKLMFPDSWLENDIYPGIFTSLVDSSAAPWYEKSGKIAYIFADIFKDDKIYFAYDVSDSIVSCKKWDNTIFGVNNIEKSSNENSLWTRWKIFEGTNAEKNRTIVAHNNVIKSVRSMLLANSVDISVNIIFENDSVEIKIKYDPIYDPINPTYIIPKDYLKNDPNIERLNVESLFIGTDVTTLMNKAFQDLSNLEHLIIGKNVGETGWQTFTRIPKVLRIALPKNMHNMHIYSLNSLAHSNTVMLNPNLNIIYYGINSMNDMVYSPAVGVQEKIDNGVLKLFLRNDLSNCTIYYINEEAELTDISFNLYDESVAEVWAAVTPDPTGTILAKPFPFD